MFQVNYSYGKSAHLPYTAAALTAYAMADRHIHDTCRLEKIFFIRDSLDNILSEISEPDVIGFSTYIWNFEFNKAVAKRVKQLYPSCVIIFGGHHVVPGGVLLEQCPFINYLIHGEGEEAFKRLLSGDNAKDIPGVSYRDNGEIYTNKSVICNDEYIDYPSAYLSGYLDSILLENPDMEFMALIETTRGCPNSCTYCDWSNMKSRIRKFPLKRVLDEIRWISEHHVFGLGSADSNFGLLKRDEEIVDYLIQMYLKNGYPKKYQTSYAKNSNERIFKIGCRLNEYNLSKGITLSFQSMSETVLNNIGRHNIPVSHYSGLMELYNAAGVPTYTELILGLPGETYDSFADGIDRLLMLGQHGSLYIHNCEWLPCSVMGTPEYVKKYNIRTSLIPLNQPHIETDVDDGITEFSNLVTGTYSMSESDWVKSNLFSFTVQSFHHMGLLEFFALYLHNEIGISYRAFYERLIKWIFSSDTLCTHRTFAFIESQLIKIAGGERTLFVCSDERFGGVQWPFEEYAFLCTVYEIDRFYDEVSDFLSFYNINSDVFCELLLFQKEMLKTPLSSDKKLHFSYDFLGYFRSLLKGNKASLDKADNTLFIKSVNCENWESYAKSIVWYGRKDSRNVYINEAEQIKDMD